MRMEYARKRSTLELAVTVVMVLSFSFVDRLHGSAAEVVADQDNRQVSHPEEKAPGVRGVCERDGEKLVGQKPVRTGRSVRPPKKLRDVAPKYPEVPPGTVGRGMWLGEVLIDNSGKIAHVWPIDEVEFMPRFPAFNSAITDAIQRWEFEPLLVQRKAVPFCLTVTVNINWK